MLRLQPCVTWLIKKSWHLEESGFLRCKTKQNQPTSQKKKKKTCALGKKNLCSDIDISHFFELPVFSPLFSLKIYMPKQHILRGMLMNYLVSYFVPDFSFLTFYSFSVNWKGMRIPERHNTQWHRNILCCRLPRDPQFKVEHDPALFYLLVLKDGTCCNTWIPQTIHRHSIGTMLRKQWLQFLDKWSFSFMAFSCFLSRGRGKARLLHKDPENTSKFYFLLCNVTLGTSHRIRDSHPSLKFSIWLIFNCARLPK